MPTAGGIPINIDPNLLVLGPFMITWHGVFTAVGTLIGVWMAVNLAQQAGFTEDDVVSVAMWGIVGAIIGARLFHVIDQWDFYSRDPIAILRINEGGLAIFGTVVGGPLVGAIYCWRKGIKVSRMADVAAIPMALGMGIGRIGDIINGEHHGSPADGFPLAFTYVHPATLGEIGKPVHLAVGYEMLLDWAVFAVIIWMARGIERGADGNWHWGWRPRYRTDGMLFWTFVALYSAGRFFVQFYRIDTIFALGLSQAQLLSVISVIVGLWGVAYLYARAARKPVAPKPLVTG